jgi:precorrin-6B methylase 1
MAAIRRLEAAIPLVMPTLDLDKITFHHHCNGVYIRQMTVPQGTVLVGKVHKEENFFMLVAGDMTVMGDDGRIIRVQAPFMIVTKPGTKRVGFAHTQCIVLNIHGNPDNETDQEVLEERFIIPEEAPTLPAHVAKILLERKTP